MHSEKATFDIWDKRTLGLICALFLWRLIFILTVPLDLAGDESYYWDWSRHLALGYFSKPPLISWINFLSSSLLPHSVFAVRAPAALFSLVTLLAVYGLSKRLFSSRTAFWSVAAFVASPGSCVLGFVMTIDAPFVCFWTVSLYCLWRAFNDDNSNNWWWLATGLAVGFGMLSKQVMLIFPVLTFIFLICSEGGKKALATTKPYLTALLSFMALLPPLWWNKQNDWITFQHTTHHFEGNKEGGLAFLKTMGDFVGGQLLLISPLTGLLLFCLSVFLFYRFLKQETKVKFLLLYSVPCLFLFLILSMRQRINANWPAVFYITATILVAAWGCGELSAGPRLNRLRKLFVPGVLLGAVFALLMYGLPYYIDGAAMGGAKYDPLKRIKGWRLLSERVEELRQQQAPLARKKTFLLAADREVVSQLAFYLPDTPQVYKWSRPNLVDCQYDLWENPSSDWLGEDGLIILKKGLAVPEKLANSFVSILKVKDLEIPLGKGGTRSFTVYLGRNLQRWPQ